MRCQNGFREPLSCAAIVLRDNGFSGEADVELRIELGSRMDGSKVLHQYFLEVLWGRQSVVYVHVWAFPEGGGECGAEFLPLSESEGQPFANEARTAARSYLAYM